MRSLAFSRPAEAQSTANLARNRLPHRVRENRPLYNDPEHLAASTPAQDPELLIDRHFSRDFPGEACRSLVPGATIPKKCLL